MGFYVIFYNIKYLNAISWHLSFRNEVLLFLQRDFNILRSALI